jgi:uncharacterized protein (TIGR02147 family)
MVPIVFEYTNYRKFIRDFYLAKKAIRKSYSYQLFACQAGFKSKSSLANITSGRQSLAKNRVFGIACAMGLSRRETEFFNSIVHFNEAKSAVEKEHYFELMRSLLPRDSENMIFDSQYEYYSKWYHCVIRELVTIMEFNDDFSLLASEVDPPITKVQAKKSVDLLMKLNLITKVSNGKYIHTKTLLSTGDEVKSLALRKYHQEHLHLASQSLNRHGGNIRDISSITGGISKNGFLKIKVEIQQFRKKLLEIISNDTSAEAVYQIAFQLYPLSTIPDKWRNHA